MIAGMVCIFIFCPNVLGIIFMVGLFIFIFVALLAKCYIFKESQENKDDCLIEDNHK
jgi:hypothetical protein